MRLRSALLCACLVSCFTQLHAAPKVPVAAFAQEEEYSNPRLSPDGKYIAITVRTPNGERTVPVVMIYTLPDLKQAGAVRMPVFEVPLYYNWVSKTRLIITKGRELGSREKPVATGEVMATEFDGSKQEYLYGYDMFRASRRGDRYGDDHGYGRIEAIPQPLTGRFLLGSHMWRSSRSMLYDIDSVSANRKLLADLPEPRLSFVMQNDGTPRFAFGTGDDSYLTFYRRNDATGEWEKPQAKLGKIYLPRMFSADDSEFAVTHSPDGGPNQLFRENLATGARTPIFSDPVGSVGTLMYGARRGMPFAATTDVGIPRVQYLQPDSEDAKLHKLLSDQFPGSHLRFVNFTEDGNTLLFAVMSDRDPGTYYLFNKTTQKADLLFSVMSQIEPDDMSERRPVAFKARDGLELHGYLTVPKHPPGTKLPMVLMPHGGPHDVNDTWFFDNDAQFLASRGYAVLQVNFRGSGGRGETFEEAGYRQWGAKVQDDLIDGVRWAVAQGEVDGARVCSYGVSFGGYSALMVAAREPAMFKCAVGYAGIYDLNLLYKEDASKRYASVLNTYKRYVGQDKAELDRFSPVTLAGRISVPVLLVHGGKDKIAPIEHADLMRDALVKVNHPPEWLLASSEGHGFYDTANITRFLETLGGFLDKHIGSK